MPSAETLPVARARLTEALIRRHQRDLWRYLRFLGCEPHLAEDLTQEVFLRILVNPPEDRGERAIGRWLRVTALNLFRSSGRSARVGVLLDADLLEQLWQREVRDDGDAYVAALRECLQVLPSEQRDAVLLRHQRRRSRSEIATEFGWTIEGCKSALRRARARLHACIERRMEETE